MYRYDSVTVTLYCILCVPLLQRFMYGRVLLRRGEHDGSADAMRGGDVVLPGRCKLSEPGRRGALLDPDKRGVERRARGAVQVSAGEVLQERRVHRMRVCQESAAELVCCE